MEISKTQIDRLGDRLRKGNITDSDLRLLDEYRRSFTATYGTVASAIRNQLDLEPTGRPAKSTTSIAEKLRRESIRLNQIQDIAGCRLIEDNSKTIIDLRKRCDSYQTGLTESRRELIELFQSLIQNPPRLDQGA